MWKITEVLAYHTYRHKQMLLHGQGLDPLQQMAIPIYRLYALPLVVASINTQNRTTDFY
jgi:hypothetical protein